MNIENINKAIAIMTRHMEARLPLTMGQWQTHSDGPTVTEEEHLCGTPCCFAGYIAVSPEFQADGGTCKFSGAPELQGVSYGKAIRKWVGCNTYQAESLCDTYNPEYAYPNGFRKTIDFPDVIAALTSLRDTGKLPGEFPGE